MKTLYYVADPMCSWCWGFQPVLEKVKEALPEELSPVYIMGGLARDTDDPMPDVMQAHIQRAWREVAAITGASFNWDFWEKCKSSSHWQVKIGLLDTKRFACDLSSPETEQQMQDGFNIRRSMNANQFPSLVIRNNASVTFITRGYNDLENRIGLFASSTGLKRKLFPEPADIEIKIGQQGIARNGFWIRQTNHLFIWTININISLSRIDKPAELRAIIDIFLHLVLYRLKAIRSRKQFDDEIGTNWSKLPPAHLLKAFPTALSESTPDREHAQHHWEG